jgi:hypothetical protein
MQKDINHRVAAEFRIVLASISNENFYKTLFTFATKQPGLMREPIVQIFPLQLAFLGVLLPQKKHLSLTATFDIVQSFWARQVSLTSLSELRLWLPQHNCVQNNPVGEGVLYCLLFPLSNVHLAILRLASGKESAENRAQVDTSPGSSKCLFLFAKSSH